MFLIKHGFCSGPLNGKSSDPSDRIEVRTVEDRAGCHGAEGSA